MREFGNKQLRRAVASTAAAFALFVMAAPVSAYADQVTVPQSANLLSAAAAGFEGATSNWTTSGGEVTTVDSPVHSGSGALAVSTGSATSALIAVRDGARYTARMWMTAKTTVRGVAAVVVFFDGSRRQLATATGQSVPDAVGTWRQTQPAIGVAPPGAAYVAAGVSISSVAAGETHVIDDVTLTTAPGGSLDVRGPLTTSGNRVLDADGNPIVLRGFTRDGLEYTGDYPGAEEMSYAKRWGANIIRLPVSESYWLSTSCKYDPSYADKLDRSVAAVTSLGMVALVDLHTNMLTACGAVNQQPMADYPNAITFWQQVAARYKNNPLVAFELYNEPHDISDDVWRDGGTVTWQGTTYRAAGMQQMYDAVRSSGASNLVIVSGNVWANWWPVGGALAGTNIVYSLHAYTCTHLPPPDCSSDTPYDVPSFVNPWFAVGNSYPVIVGEFGFPDKTEGRYNANLIAVAEAHGWGWTMFTWGSSTWGPFDLLATAGGGATYEPAPSGMPALAAFPIPGKAPTGGQWQVPGVGTTQIGQAGDVPAPGDYNGDGRTDQAVFHPATGDWYIRGRAPQHWGTAGDVPVPGDYNRDGKTDLAVWRPSNGNWYVQGRAAVHWGTSGDVPVAADYTGDRRTDLAVWRPSNGTWYVQGQPSVHYGTAGDIPAPGDLTGAGKARLVVFRPSNGNWYAAGLATVHWGTAGDVPVLADYTGDRRADRAVWRPSTGQWYVEHAASSLLGVSGDVPVPGQYNGKAGADRAIWHPPSE